MEKFSLADLHLSPSVFIQSRFHSSRSFGSTSYAIRCAHALPCLNIYKCRASRHIERHDDATVITFQRSVPVSFMHKICIIFLQGKIKSETCLVDLVVLTGHKMYAQSMHHISAEKIIFA